MKINKIKIQNFKSFKEKNIELNDKFTLIIGINGTGKTSLLEAISVGLSGFLVGLDGVKPRNILEDDIRTEWDKPGDATVTYEHQVPVIIECEGMIDNQEVSWRRSRSKVEQGRTNRIQAKEIINIAEEMQSRVREKDRNVKLPVFSYQSAGRLFSQKKNKWNDPFKKENMSRFVGYTDCLEPESNIKLFVNWLKQMNLIEIQKRKKIGELDAVLSSVQEFMKILLDNDDPVSINYDFEEKEVLVHLRDTGAPLRIMSAGYRTIIGMVADIAYRMAILNPQLKERASKETPGIVLIDEIDLHLHPKWQWTIVNALKKTFPEVQFIATTHAPIVISSCDETDIIQLHEEDGEIHQGKINTPYGWLIEDILNDVMGTYSRDPEVEKVIVEVQQLYRKKVKGSITEQEKNQLIEKSRYLNKILPESDPAVTMAQLDAINEIGRSRYD